MENKSNTLSVVVPVYNEEDNILPLVSAVHNALIDERRQWELLIVDDGSSDDTWAVSYTHLTLPTSHLV